MKTFELISRSVNTGHSLLDCDLHRKGDLFRYLEAGILKCGDVGRLQRHDEYEARH